MYEPLSLSWWNRISSLIIRPRRSLRDVPCATSPSSPARGIRLSHPLSAPRSYSSCDTDNESFYRYSGGRWLWDEEKQLQTRYKRFNVPELQRLAAKSVEAQACVSMIKLAEGGFNKVFRLVMDDDSVVIARIPNPNAGPSFKTTASEVATMDFARTILKIPVPKVLAWSGSSKNPVGSEYILMEEASGTPLYKVWEGMEIHDKLKIVDDIVDIEKKLLSISFTRSDILMSKS
ncbi:hypothetical protein FOPE_06512 [Fonsecaea pedrosoi]|nr:hypothetical protein FOPE_06512 [Fonsecaea pedrosoi]